jgi:hypothetical protein
MAHTARVMRAASWQVAKNTSMWDNSFGWGEIAPVSSR